VLEQVASASQAAQSEQHLWNVQASNGVGSLTSGHDDGAMQVEDTQSAKRLAVWHERTRSLQATSVEQAVVEGKQPPEASPTAGHICG
jgi:hypothetical protein